MAKLYAEVSGDNSRTNASRIGHREIESWTNGWNAGVRVRGFLRNKKASWDDDVVFHVYATGGSNSHRSDKLIAIIESVQGEMKLEFPDDHDLYLQRQRREARELVDAMIAAAAEVRSHAHQIKFYREWEIPEIGMDNIIGDMLPALANIVDLLNNHEHESFGADDCDICSALIMVQRIEEMIRVSMQNV